MAPALDERTAAGSLGAVSAENTKGEVADGLKLRLARDLIPVIVRPADRGVKDRDAREGPGTPAFAARFSASFWPTDDTGRKLAIDVPSGVPIDRVAVPTGDVAPTVAGD